MTFALDATAKTVEIKHYIKKLKEHEAIMSAMLIGKSTYLL